MQLRIAICIPVYNHPDTVGQIISECLQLTDLHVLVIDDGSDIPVKEKYLSDHSDNAKLHFVRHHKNLGKGKALQTAIAKSVSMEFTHMVTIDADGQHDPAEIKKLVEAAYVNPWAIIIGDRQMQTMHVPKSSVFGKAFSNFWVKYETDQFVGDSQSGFRVYPLFYLQTIRFYSKKYDFEIEVLTRLIWKGVEVKCVPISVKYFPPEKRVTHFNKFKDNVRLTILNAVLVTGSLLRRKDSAFKSSLAVAIGVFVGSYPVYGLHTLIVALLALFLRMNFIYLWLGTQISIPPMIPFIILGSHYASELYLGRTPQGIFGLSQDWLIGISLFALTASIIVGTAVYLFKKSVLNSIELKKSKVSSQSQIGFGVHFMNWIVRTFGLQTAYAFLFLIAPYYYLFSNRVRTSTNQYWKVIRPEIGVLRRQVKVLQQIFVFAQVLVDRAYQKTSEKMEFQVVEGPGIENFKSEINHSPKGHVTLQCHVGGWEISMGYFRHRYVKWNKKMMAVMYGKENSYQHSSIKTEDESLEVTLFNTKQDTIIKLKSFLERGDLVGLMADRPVGRSYELVLFCGKLALFDSTGIRLVQLCQAKLFFVFSLRHSFKNYSVNAVAAEMESKVFENLDKDEKVIYLLKQYSKELELHLRTAPEQWFNFFPFWSETLF